jgi:hypothetical protein
MPWLKPSLALRWGSYTKLDGDEQGQIVDATIKAKDGGLITRRMAVEKIAPIFGIENVDAVIAALEKEDATNAAKALEQNKAEQKALHELASKNANQSGLGDAGQEESQGA